MRRAGLRCARPRALRELRRIVHRHGDMRLGPQKTLPDGRHFDAFAYQHLAVQLIDRREVFAFRGHHASRSEARELPCQPGLLLEDLRLRPVPRDWRRRLALGQARAAKRGGRRQPRACTRAGSTALDRPRGHPLVSPAGVDLVAGEIQRRHRLVVRRLHIRRADRHVGRFPHRGPRPSVPRHIVLPPFARQPARWPAHAPERPAQHDLQFARDPLGHGRGGVGT
mmetsp:Transcript_4841/g.9833  ORF Transcript_4841/g.9833 Transcript_4841/m.9833 type:complete len:225 (-) Transcript_4841:157-831(-)